MFGMNQNTLQILTVINQNVKQVHRSVIGKFSNTFGRLVYNMNFFQSKPFWSKASGGENKSFFW